MGRWIQRHRRASTLAVSLLILALLPTPWPKVEFHNVRHHDSPGQVCEYHDHLLRWHPDATGAADMAVLHWHWAWPSQEDAHSGHDGAGPRLHAYLSQDDLPAVNPGSAFVADTAVRASLPPTFEFAPSAVAFDPPPRDPLGLRAGIPPSMIPGALFAPRASLTSRLHRWSC